jgi:PAS domain S-box-containing protein
MKRGHWLRVLSPAVTGDLVPLLTLVLVGVTLITIVSFIYTRRAAEALAINNVSETLHFLDREVDARMRAMRRELAQWSRESIFSMALSDTYLGRSAREAANRHLAERTTDRGIDRILLIDSDGTVLASSAPGIAGVINVADREYFQRALKGASIVEGLPQGRTDDRPIMVIAGPVASREGGPSGVMALVLDTERFAREILDGVHVGQSGGAYFVDRKSGVRVTPTWTTPGQFDPGPHLAALESAAGSKQVVRYPGLDTERLAMSTTNAQSGLLLVVEDDSDAILRPAARLATVNGLIAFIILGLAAILLGVLHQTMTGLRASEARFRSLIETSPLGVVTFDSAGHVTYLNERAEDILGLHGAMGQLPENWMLELEDDTGTVLPAEALPMFQVLASGQRILGWTAWRRAEDGTRRVLSLSAASLAQEGQSPGVVAMVEDVTDLHRARLVLQQSKEELKVLVERRTRELTEANRRLMELDGLKNNFLNTVSHDLRTPLTSVLGFAKLIQREFAKRFTRVAESDPSLRKGAKTIRANLAIIVSEGERLTRLINDLLDLSRIESGRYQWREVSMDLAALIREAALAMSAAFDEKPQVSLHLDIPPKDFPLRLDPDRIMQVLTNLLSNALKFTDRGEIRLSLQEQGSMARVTLADTGVGMPAEELPHIFNRFYQVGGQLLEGKPLGSGLGLAICKQIVEHYGGTIWAESNPNVGSTFCLELPMDLATSQAAAFSIARAEGTVT